MAQQAGKVRRIEKIKYEKEGKRNLTKIGRRKLHMLKRTKIMIIM